MEYCFNKDIYLPQLLDRFWRLTLQIISRLNVWINSTLNANIPIEIPAIETDATEQKANLRLKFLCYLHIDVTTLNNRLCNIENIKFLQEFIPRELQPKINVSLREFTTKTFPACLSYIETIIVDSIYKDCSIYVKNVSQIPRLYRKTNRNIPTSASSYVTLMCKPIDDFYEKHSDKLSSDVMNVIMENVHEKVTSEYRSLVENVLTSVAKTEESLRRLKKTRGNNENQESSDDQKIRMQVQLDVLFYSKRAEKYVDVRDLIVLAKDVTPPKDG